jgi:hypothetical protein
MVDVEALTLAWLRGYPTMAGVTIGTERPADLAARLPYVQITRIGGGATPTSWRSGPMLDRAGVNAQTWATPDRATARILIHQVIGALMAARSLALPGGVIVAVTMLAGPSSLPDPAAVQQVHRFTTTLQMTVREHI